MRASAVGALLVSLLGAQQGDLRGRLIARGASPELAQRVSQLATSAEGEDLPAQPIADKAFEGLAKGYPPERVLPVVQTLIGRLRAGREAAVAAGVVRPPGRLVAANAEALGRGIDRADVIEVLRSARAPDAAAIGVTIAASLAAQGITPREAARAVISAYRDGHTSQELLELPSIASSWITEGVTLPEVARRMREGLALPVPPGRSAVKPIPGKGPPINPPGRNKRPP